MRTITLALTSQGNETSLSEVAALGAALTAASAELRGMPLETVDAGKLAAEMRLGIPYDPGLELHAAAAAALSPPALPGNAPPPAAPNPASVHPAAAVAPGPPAQPQVVRVVKTAAIIESSGMGHVAESEVEIQRVQNPMAPQLLPGGGMVMQAAQAMVREEVVRSGWRRYG